MLSSPPFLTKTYDMVDDPSTDKIVSWSSQGHSFIVWSISDLCTVLLPQYFKHNNFSSFVRQLNTYGFRKICSDQWEFATDGFSRGNKDGLKTIHRRKPSTSPSSSSSSSMDHLVADQQHTKCLYTESVCSKLLETTARLQQDKASLVIDLTNLNRERRLTDEDLDEFKEQLLMLENRQQQILSLITQAAMNPGLFNTVTMQRVVEIQALMPIKKKRKLFEANDEEIIVQFEDDQCWRKSDQFNRIDNAITSSTMSPMRILGRHSMSLLGGNRSKKHVTRMDMRIATKHNLNDVCEDVMPHHFQVNDNRGQIALHKVSDCVVSSTSQSACKEMDKRSVVQSLQTNEHKEMDKNSTNNGFWGKYLTESPTTDVESDVETDVENEGNPQ